MPTCSRTGKTVHFIKLLLLYIIFGILRQGLISQVGPEFPLWSSWPGTPTNPPASASQVLELQVWVIIPGYNTYKISQKYRIKLSSGYMS